MQAYLEGVWGEAAARFRLLAENTGTARTGGADDRSRCGCPSTSPARPSTRSPCGPTAIGTWWPRDHTVSGARRDVVLEGGVGGRIYERTRRRRRARLGRGHGLGAARRRWPTCGTWAATAADATEVEIRFVAAGRATRPGSRSSTAAGSGSAPTAQRLARAQPASAGRRLLPHFLAAAIATEEDEQLMAAGTKEDPWVLTTPPGTSSYTMYRDEAADPPALVCQVGSTTLKYQLRAIEDLHAWLAAQGDWVPLGAADEQKPAADGHGRGVGPVRGQPGRRLVRPAQGLPRPVRHVPAAAARGARPGRAHPRRPQQPMRGDRGGAES